MGFRNSLLLLVSLTSFVKGQDTPAPAPLFLLEDATLSAKCLDGSPGAYYHRSALNDSFATKWVFSLQGGGECVDEASCADRATGDLGSSLGYPSDGSDNLSQFQDGNEDHNPDFYGWNHVFIMYCTGDLFMGTVDEPGDNQWGWAYFSGAFIVDAVIQDLQTRQDLVDTHYSLEAADTVIWSGDSAGGIGSGASLDFAAALLPNAKVVGAPIAGFYWNNDVPYTGEGAIDYIPFDVDAFAGYWDMWEMRVPDGCATALSSTPWACGLLNYSLPHLTSDIFVIEMLVDSVQLYLHSGVAEYDDNTAPYVTNFGRVMTNALTTDTIYARSDGPRTGLFAASCFEHTSFYYDKPLLIDSDSGKDISFVDAFGDWLLRGDYPQYHIDGCCSNQDFVVFNPTC